MNDLELRLLNMLEQAMARAWQVLMDERLFWVLALDRFVYTYRGHFDNWFR